MEEMKPVMWCSIPGSKLQRFSWNMAVKRKSNSGNEPKAKASKPNAEQLEKYPHVAQVTDWLLVWLFYGNGLNDLFLGKIPENTRFDPNKMRRSSGCCIRFSREEDPTNTLKVSTMMRPAFLVPDIWIMKSFSFIGRWRSWKLPNGSKLLRPQIRGQSLLP